jgi:hypothetical protein
MPASSSPHRPLSCAALVALAVAAALIGPFLQPAAAQTAPALSVDDFTAAPQPAPEPPGTAASAVLQANEATTRRPAGAGSARKALLHRGAVTAALRGHSRAGSPLPSSPQAIREGGRVAGVPAEEQQGASSGRRTWLYVAGGAVLAAGGVLAAVLLSDDGGAGGPTSPAGPPGRPE